MFVPAVCVMFQLIQPAGGGEPEKLPIILLYTELFTPLQNVPTKETVLMLEPVIVLPLKLPNKRLPIVQFVIVACSIMLLVAASPIIELRRLPY